MSPTASCQVGRNRRPVESLVPMTGGSRQPVHTTIFFRDDDIYGDVQAGETGKADGVFGFHRVQLACIYPSLWVQMQLPLLFPSSTVVVFC